MTEGERWARALLRDLRAGSFRPRAWGRFLHSSLVRANLRRRERRTLWLEAVVLLLVGTAAWAAIGASGRPGLALAGGIWWVAVYVMLDWHLGMIERLDGTPLAHLGAPNLLALLRAGVVPALPALSPRALALALAVAHVTDVADGWVARSLDQVTRLGEWLDGAVDTLLLGAAAVVLARGGLLPAWVATLVVIRFAAPALVVALAYFARAEPPPRAGYVPGRVPGFVLLVGLIVAALALPGATALAAVGAAGGLTTFAATVVRLTSRYRASQLSLRARS